MDDDDGFSPDPELAAALGFSSFGAQPSTKRRKYNTYDAVVDVDVPHGSAANSLPLGQRPPKADINDAAHYPSAVHNAVVDEKQENAAEAADGANVQPAPSKTDPVMSSILQKWNVETQGPRKFSQPELQTLREGVRLPGDTITYFLPSFIEDPWKEG